jgi:hypothetical protein
VRRVFTVGESLDGSARSGRSRFQVDLSKANKVQLDFRCQEGTAPRPRIGIRQATISPELKQRLH